MIRFLDREAKDIIPRKFRIKTRAGVAKRMVETPEKKKRPVPEELKALAKESIERPLTW